MSASSDLTIQVLNLSPRVTLQELNIFFSYCGTVEKIHLQRNKDRSQTALVTFTQPYPFRTALLLNDAIFAGQPIRIFPAKDSPTHIIPVTFTNEENKEVQGFIPVLHAGMQVIASKSVEVLNKTREEIEENYKLSEKSKLLADQTRTVVSAAEQAAGHICVKIVEHDYISSSANWLSSVFDKAAKHSTELGTRKQK